MFRFILIAIGVALVGYHIHARADEPAKVFVVNTQDASVSLVDLRTMKEERRFPVGPRPYGIAVTQDGRTVAVGVEDEEAVRFKSAQRRFGIARYTTIGVISIQIDHIIKV